jgi:hypothetical protein
MEAGGLICGVTLQSRIGFLTTWNPVLIDSTLKVFGKRPGGDDLHSVIKYEQPDITVDKIIAMDR